MLWAPYPFRLSPQEDANVVVVSLGSVVDRVGSWISRFSSGFLGFSLVFYVFVFFFIL